MSLTIQEMFDTIYTHFSQPNACLAKNDPYGACMYRMTNEAGQECSCAVGCLIPDALYQGQMEGSLGHCLSLSPELRDLLLDPEDWVESTDGYGEYSYLSFDGDKGRFLRAMQHLHDDSNTVTVADLLARLREYAETFDLTVPEVA